MPDCPTVLIIDDDEPFRLSLHDAFENAHFHVLDTGSGKRALELAVANPPDAIVCDYQMDEINGVEVLRQLRMTSSLSQVPAFLISGAPPNEIVPHLNSLGRTEFLAKPFLLSDLVNSLHSTLSLTASACIDPTVQFELHCKDVANYLTRRFPAIDWRINRIPNNNAKIAILASVVRINGFIRSTLTTTIEVDAYKGLGPGRGEYETGARELWAESVLVELRKGVSS